MGKGQTPSLFLFKQDQHHKQKGGNNMSFEIMHFRQADKIIKEKKMKKEVQLTLEYLDNVLYGTVHRGELMRQALDELDWRMNGDLNILEGRRYYYKGYKKGIAIEGNFSSYEFIQDGLLRLQIGKDKGKIDVGILLLTSHRSDKSPYGSTKQLVEKEIQHLYPTISLPVTIVLFDLGIPYGMREEETSAATKGTDDFQNGAGNDQAMTGETDFQGQDEDWIESPVSESKAMKPDTSRKQSRSRKKKPVNPDTTPETELENGGIPHE
jgi:hypothetical protein